MTDMLDARQDRGAIELASDTTKAGSKAKSPKRRSDRENADGSLGRALRSVYQHTVDENVPDEMLDLLRKLD